MVQPGIGWLGDICALLRIHQCPEQLRDVGSPSVVGHASRPIELPHKFKASGAQCRSFESASTRQRLDLARIRYAPIVLLMMLVSTPSPILSAVRPALVSRVGGSGRLGR